MTDYERFGDYIPQNRGTLGVALTFLFVGLGIGAVTALMLAPQSGRKLRRDLRRRYEDVADRVGDWKDQANDAWERGSGWANEKVSPISTWAKRATQR